ncbi:MAG: hypothetical protein ACXVPU_17690 [Bacteroidia bacterium]
MEAAKQEATRKKRIDQAAKKIIENIGMNDHYLKK